ncbi:MAG TPA: alanine racemase [Terriglobales bacterium]|nr:alanine racemase [Terriglobales bacterium]
MNVHELSTPALVVDLDIVERNLDTMAALCRQQGVHLRPHTKTHKTPEVARMQLERGAVGVTVAKVGEAEVMGAGGLDEILVAYPVIGTEKLRRLATLAHERSVLVSLDDERTAQELSRAAVKAESNFGILVEFDSGYRRCGLKPGPACAQLATKIEKLPGLRFRGLLTYFGSVWGSADERRAEANRMIAPVRRAVEAMAAARVPVEIVSGGSTPAAEFSSEIPGLTEIRPGTYVYNDLNTFYQGACQLEDCAVRILTTVVSTAVQGHAMIDAGSKTLSSDPLSAGPKAGFGLIMEAPDAPLFKLSEEHGHVDAKKSQHWFSVGEVLSIIPNHICTCVNLHDEAFLIRNNEVVGSWRVAGRGKIR